MHDLRPEVLDAFTRDRRASLCERREASGVVRPRLADAGDIRLYGEIEQVRRIEHEHSRPGDAGGVM
jgi:hypothetical protein